VRRDSADPALVLDSHNLVGTGTQFVDQVDFVPVSGGPAIDSALLNADTPVYDRRGSPRGAMPDLGAWEVGSPSCP
jgi:hypothetical protein